MDDQTLVPWNIFDNLPDPILVLDRDCRITAANNAAVDLFGTKIQGLNLVLILRQPAALAAASVALEGGGPETVEITFYSSIPRTFRVIASAVPRNDGVSQAVIIMHDTTNEKRVESMRADFVANVSHELRSPLASLLGFIETLLGPARDDDKVRGRFLDIMKTEAERMARLIDDLLSLSRLEADEHIHPRHLLALSPILLRAAEVVRDRAKAKGIKLVMDIPENLPNVLGDDDQLMQVFQNLFDNAIKYGCENSAIIVSVNLIDTMPRQACPGVIVSIADQGDGIPAHHLPRITERFYRVDKARSKSLGGTGLGLAIVKHIVGRHRGQLGITSTEGEGSTFTVTLPVA